MPQDYYPDTGNSDKPESEAETDDGGATDGVTFLVPKSAIPGDEVKPGDVCDFEAVHVYEDEIEFKYKKAEKGETEPNKSAMDESMGEMESMAGEGE